MTKLPKYLTQDELKRFFAAIDAPRDRALFGVMYHYGLRVGEALMLTVDDVNFKNHRITIRRLKSGLGGEKSLWRHTAKLLRSYLRERRDVGPYLFTGRKGPLQKRQVQKLFTDYAEAAGIKARSVHALRHSMANSRLNTTSKLKVLARARVSISSAMRLSRAGMPMIFSCAFRPSSPRPSRLSILQ